MSVTGGSGGAGGSGVLQLDALLAALSSDVAAAMLQQSRQAGWPAPVEGGYLVVSTEPAADRVAGDHDGWTGTTMNAADGYHWLVLDLAPGDRYKFTNGASSWIADPWSRAYAWDDNGQMSMRAPLGAHLERHFEVADTTMAPRTVRVWLPASTASHVVYAHDGQNLFNPGAVFGGWKLSASVPEAMMLVGIDNTAWRMDEYTHVSDSLNGQLVGGGADAYADFVVEVVRALVAQHYGEPTKRAVMGSSLGGLASFHIADRHPGVFHFAASLSGTMGWGSIGMGQQNETMIERYQASGLGTTALYLDSGGGGSCVDSDGDGIEDDATDGSDNYCENKQLEGVLQQLGYMPSVSMWHDWEPGAPHNEAAWAARVWRPLEIFEAL